MLSNCNCEARAPPTSWEIETSHPARPLLGSTGTGRDTPLRLHSASIAPALKNVRAEEPLLVDTCFDEGDGEVIIYEKIGDSDGVIKHGRLWRTMRDGVCPLGRGWLDRGP